MFRDTGDCPEGIKIKVVLISRQEPEEIEATEAKPHLNEGSRECTNLTHLDVIARQGGRTLITLFFEFIFKVENEIFSLGFFDQIYFNQSTISLN